MTRYLLLGFLLTINFNLFSQTNYTIKGVITDATSGETLPGATVFFAETTYGAISDSSGVYQFRIQESGSYNLIVRFLGYETFQTKVDLYNQNEITINVSMDLAQRDLGSFVLIANRDKLWKEYFKQFERLFLGTSINAKVSKIENEEVVDFYTDASGEVLYGYADEPIIINNKRLGYMIEFYLEKFIYDKENNLSSYEGYTLFKPKDARNKRQQRRWNRERDQAYFGSMQHFFRSLFEGNYGRQGFAIKNEGYLLKTSVDSTRNLEFLFDHKLKNENEYVKRLELSGTLVVEYLNEIETREYKIYQGNRFGIGKGSQLSWIEFDGLEPNIRFDQSGYVINSKNLVINGYWGFERVADLVPFHYKPIDLNE